ncbi:MAG: MTAP family purine nucleoside phosphorylase [Candidatus Heimdallarchaeaceae archaeon]
MKIKRAIIGGSGVYEIFEESEPLNVNAFGRKVTLYKLQRNGKEVFFLPRHGKDHSVPPHKIDYLGNIYALYSLGVTEIIATNAVGSIIPEVKPGEFVLPDQFIDNTRNRVLTFFSGEKINGWEPKIKLSDGTIREGVVHLDYTEPYCPRLRNLLGEITEKFGEKVHYSGVYVCSEGPRFETPAEVEMYRRFGGTIAGMTTVPEAVLAREANMCYATLCLVTNYGAGMQKKVTHEEVIELFNEKTQVVRKIIENAVFSDVESLTCNCRV